MTPNMLLEERTATRPWQLGALPESYVISNVRAVLPDRITEESAIAVNGGRIAEVVENARGLRGDIDGGGLVLSPGFVDVHNDGLEKEREPRPTAALPWDFALASYESKVAAAGITTVFHGAGFHRNSSQGIDRTPQKALELCRTVDEHVSARVDHQVLHRFNVRGDGSELIERRLSNLTGDTPILLSNEDHTPGQGQYADVDKFIDSLVAGGEDRAEATLRVRERIAAADETEDLRRRNLEWMSDNAAKGTFRLIGHDLDSPEAVDRLVEQGGVVAEFPTTLAAAQRARQRGLVIVAGAPNVLRGGSHSGNVSAAELLHHGLVDALASDYLLSGLLGSVAMIARRNVIAPHEVFSLVTAGPAAAVGYTDRGTLAEGQRADFTLIDGAGAWPRVITTFSSQEVNADEHAVS